MKTTLKSLIALVLLCGFATAQVLKPYILGASSDQDLASVKALTSEKLLESGFSLLGSYQPADDASRWVLVITSEDILKACQAGEGLTAFAAVLRIGLTQEEGRVNISYTNPVFLGNAYFQKNYAEVSQYFISSEQALQKLMPELGQPHGEAFGMEEGMDPKTLQHYHYMFGMEYFEDAVTLTEFSNYENAKAIIRSRLAKGGDTRLVYSVEIPGKRATLYGIALGGEKGESHFLPLIDLETPKHTAFLPYEILLLDNTALMLHGRFRIALAFPDLKMSTFGKIMSTPGDIETLLRSVTE